MAADAPNRGGRAHERVRTVLVVSTDGEVAVALRERLDRAYVVVRDVRPEEVTASLADPRTWPWMLIGTGPDLPPDVAGLLRLRPALTGWYGPSPSGLPSHSLGYGRFSELATSVAAALANEVAGMHLAPGAGVDLPGGGYSSSASLEALVSAHPRPFDLPIGTFRSAARALAKRGIPMRPGRHPRTNLVSLMPVEESAW
jgi:hypothetical protein